jgi:fido (protein-threonine AMPylation protein)
MRTRAQRYRDSVGRFKRTSQATQRDEQQWYANLGLTGRFVDLFNRVSRTDPNRWTVVFVKWDRAEANLDATLSIPVDDAHINTIGTAGQTAMDTFSEAYRLDTQYREEFSGYLQGFAHSAQGIATVATVVRDISFAAAVGIAVVVAAPVVFAAAGTATAALGVTGTTAVVLQTGATAVALGGMGAAIEGTGQATAALVVEGSQLLSDLCNAQLTWQQALDRFDWGTVASEGWAGMKRGFVDGVLAYAGLGAERALHAGARVALNTVLGEAAQTMTAQMMRRALERAIAGGATGGVIGALDAGVKAAMEGKDIGEIGIAMERGFVLGAAIGTALGGGAGALEGRAAARSVPQMTEELEGLLRTDPEAFARRFNELVSGMSASEREAFAREVAGRRFVDAAHYGPAQEAQAAGRTSVPPEHRYGADAFMDWTTAARTMEEHARTGQPLTVADLQAAHREAANSLPTPAGRLRAPGEDVLAGGGMGMQGWWSALSPEQLRVLQTNPHIELQMRGLVDAGLTAEQVAARFETAVITYPPGDQVRTRMEAFFAWYNANRNVGDPVAFAAAAQREMVSIHPFCDGNGRMSRLIMDHALESRGLPPALLRDPNIDYMVTSAAWQAEVRAGVVETFETAARHSRAFNEALRGGDPRRMAAAWQAILALAPAIRWLFVRTFVLAGKLRQTEIKALSPCRRSPALCCGGPNVSLNPGDALRPARCGE